MFCDIVKPNCVKVEAIHRLAFVTGHLQTMFLAVHRQVKVQEDKYCTKAKHHLINFTVYKYLQVG